MPRGRHRRGKRVSARAQIYAMRRELLSYEVIAARAAFRAAHNHAARLAAVPGHAEIKHKDNQRAVQQSLDEMQLRVENARRAELDLPRLDNLFGR